MSRHWFAAIVLIALLCSGCISRGCQPTWSMEWTHEGMFDVVEGDMPPVGMGLGFAHERANATYGVYYLRYADWVGSTAHFEVHPDKSVVAIVPGDADHAEVKEDFLRLMKDISLQEETTWPRLADQLMAQPVVTIPGNYIVDPGPMSLDGAYSGRSLGPQGDIVGRASEQVGSYTFHFDIGQKFIRILGPENEYSLTVDSLDRARFSGESPDTFATSSQRAAYAEEGRTALEAYLRQSGLSTEPIRGIEFEQVARC